MNSYSVLFFFCLSSCILATSDPATGHYLGKKPVDSWISTVSDQKFAWFQIDPSKVNQHGSTCGTCYATTEVPSHSQLEADSGYDVFFWQHGGGESGVGTGPIRDPNDGEPGYEDDSGHFHKGNPPSDQKSGGEKTGATASDSGSGKDTNAGDTSSGTGSTSSGKISTSRKGSHKHAHSGDCNHPDSVGNWKRFSLVL